MKTAIELITEERTRQVTVEGYSAAHDDRHYNGELAAAASCYAKFAQLQELGDWSFEAMSGIASRSWHFDLNSWKPAEDKVTNLVRAGALIVAEIERLQRQA